MYKKTGAAGEFAIVAYMSGSELSQNGADIYNHCDFCEIAEISPRKRKRRISISNGREVPLLRFCRFPHCHSRQWDPVELRWGVSGSIANRLKGGPAGGAMESQGQARGRHEHAVCGLHGWCSFSPDFSRRYRRDVLHVVQTTSRSLPLVKQGQLRV